MRKLKKITTYLRDICRTCNEILMKSQKDVRRKLEDNFEEIINTNLYVQQKYTLKQ